MSATMTTLDKALKDFYLPALRSQLNDGHQVLTLLDKKKVDMEGRHAILSLLTGRNSSVVNRAEGATFSETIGNAGYTEARVPMRYSYADIEVTGQSIRATKSDKGSYVRAVRSEMERATADIKRDRNRQVLGRSNGAIAPVGTTNNSTVVNLATTCLVNEVRQIFPGMRVDIGTVAEAAAGSGGAIHDGTVSAVSKSGFTITLGTAVTTTPGDFVFVFGNGGATTSQKELTGLQSIVSDSGTLQNVDPASVPEWVATVNGNSGTARSISETLMAEVTQDIEIASGESVDLGLCSEGVWRAYANLLSSQKRFQTTKLDGGYEALTFSAGGGAIPIIWDRDVPGHRGTSTVGGQMFFLNRKHLFLGTEAGWEWMQEDGSVLSRHPNKDAYKAKLFDYSELFTDKRNAHGKITDILPA